MSISDLLLGYDAREALSSPRGAWSKERRQSHLLRQELAKPLSVDSEVWPSVFEVFPHLIRPDWTGYVQDLWDDLLALTKVVEPRISLESEQISYIAVELVSSTTSGTMLAVWQDRVRAVSSPHLSELTRTLAGYDVADYFLLSGLTNCGSPHWADPQEWSPRLNQYHLFQDAATAVAFKAEADKHVPEHAPFFVFALWLIDPCHQSTEHEKRHVLSKTFI